MENPERLNVKKSLTQDINDGIETLTLEYLQSFTTAFEQTQDYLRSRDAATDVIAAMIKANKDGE